MLGDVVAVPAEFEVFCFWGDEEVEEFHDEGFVVLIWGDAHQFAGDREDGVREVTFGKVLAAGHVGVEEVLDAPDAAFGGRGRGGWPWGKLFGDGAEVWPAAGAGFCGCRCGDGAVVLDFGGGEEVADDDEAVALEGVEVGVRG